MTGNNYRIHSVEFDAKPIDQGLYIVATPIGNLSDITVRSLEVLASCDVIACEDTRTSRKLLDRYQITTRTVAYHEHNAEFASGKIIEALDEGKTIAVISDAGTPLISDPGFRVVNDAIAAGHKVIPVPGASSVLTALMAAGLPTDSFYYAGFLPSKEKARTDRFKELGAIKATLIFFESPHRITASLKNAISVLGEDRQACICRELTKSHEEFVKGSLKELHETFEARNVKGEVVFVIAPPQEEEVDLDEDITPLLIKLASEMSTSQAASEASRITGRSRKDLYQQLLSLKSDTNI
ncbi:MAG: 16S rRNA (cytidine(1402)-2'-O)-methyltransferase [Lentilitoribacter sp.]